MTDRIVELIQQVGELGVGLLILLETVVPPIPSEVVLPFAGFAAADGRIDPYLAWLAATTGSLLGAYVLYWLGAALSYERLHHLAGKPWFLLFGQRDLERGQRFFDRHGHAVVLVGRFIPFIRSVVSVPAGLTRMPLLRFSLLTASGSGLWNAVFIYAGYQLGDNYTAVEGYLAPTSKAVGAIVLLGLVWLVVRRLRERRVAQVRESVGAGAARAPETSRRRWRSLPSPVWGTSRSAGRRRGASPSAPRCSTCPDRLTSSRWSSS